MSEANIQIGFRWTLSLATFFLRDRDPDSTQPLNRIPLELARLCESTPCKWPSTSKADTELLSVLSCAVQAPVKRGQRPRKTTAITLLELEIMLATYDGSLEGVRDRALLCFGFASGGRRRSETAAADVRDLRRIGDQGYLYRLGHSKTQPAGVTASSTPDKPALDRAALALEDWLEPSGII